MEIFGPTSSKPLSKNSYANHFFNICINLDYCEYAILVNYTSTNANIRYRKK